MEHRVISRKFVKQPLSVIVDCTKIATMNIELTNRNKDTVKKNGETISDGDWLRSFKGCEHYTDEEAKSVVESLDILATIMLENAAQRVKENTKDICIRGDEQTVKIAA